MSESGRSSRIKLFPYFKCREQYYNFVLTGIEVKVVTQKNE